MGQIPFRWYVSSSSDQAFFEDTMIISGMNYRGIPGKKGQCESACEGMASALWQDKGREKSGSRTVCREPGMFLIIPLWSEQIACQAGITVDAFRNVANWGEAGSFNRSTHRLY